MEKLKETEEIIETPDEVIVDEPIAKTESTETALIEYKEIDEPCVALTIIGENRLTETGIFIRRSMKFSFKAFFSTIVLTIMNMFI